MEHANKYYKKKNALGSYKRVTCTHYISVTCIMQWRAKYWRNSLQYFHRNLRTTLWKKRHNHLTWNRC